MHARYSLELSHVYQRKPSEVKVFDELQNLPNPAELWPFVTELNDLPTLSKVVRHDPVTGVWRDP